MSTMGQNLERSFSYLERETLRALVAVIDHEMSDVAAQGGPPSDELRASWEKLVQYLDLGRAPEVRECPSCNHIGMRDATVCGYCWTALSQLGPEAHI
jgi:hypothetical protein